LHGQRGKRRYLETLNRSMTDEHILAMLADEGQRERGFRCLAERYQDRLYAHIRRLVLDADDAFDVLQNALVKVWRNVDRFRGQSRLYTWLYRIATNEALSFLEQQRRRQAAPLDETALAARLTADPEFEGDALQAQLLTALAQLPEKQRLVFNLRYFDEMNYQDMSDVLETSVGALKASYHHAVKKIERYLTEHTDL